MTIDGSEIEKAAGLFSFEFGDQLTEHARSPRAVTALEVCDDGSLRAPVYSSAKDTDTPYPHLISLSVSLSESDELCWHVTDSKIPDRWDIDNVGATRLTVDHQGRLLKSDICDDAEYDKVASLVCAMLAHPETEQALEAMRETRDNSDLSRLKKELEERGERRSEKEDAMLRTLASVGMLGIAGVSLRGKMGIVDRKVYPGRS